jgi:recombinase-like zinc beta ribbon protein
MTAASRHVVRAGGDTLTLWAERSGRLWASEPGRGGLRFAFYGRVSTEDYQDPVTSRSRQRDQTAALVAGFGRIVAEFFDAGHSRVLPWARRPQAAALLAALADPDCDFDAIVVGEYERAFYGSQYALMTPLFEHYGVQLWMPEAGGRVNFHVEGDEQLMLALGVQSKREITRTRIRVRTAMGHELIDPANTGLGHRQVQRWALPDGWVISARPSHPALVSEENFIDVQGIRAERDTGPAAGRQYLLAGLLRCGTCGRRLESCWANNRPGYRCRHGYTSAVTPDPARPKNLYIREDHVLARLPALHALLTSGEPPPGRRRRRTRRGVDVTHPASEQDVIGYLRARGITLIYDPRTKTLRPDTPEAATAVIARAS